MSHFALRHGQKAKGAGRCPVALKLKPVLPVF